jgi:hypothetical protein
VREVALADYVRDRACVMFTVKEGAVSMMKLEQKRIARSEL